MSFQLLVLKASAQKTQRRCPPSTEGDAEEQEAKRSASQRSRVHTWFGLRVRRQGRPARQEWERIYAEDPNFADVSDRSHNRVVTLSP